MLTGSLHQALPGWQADGVARRLVDGLTRAHTRARQARCGLRGHDLTLDIERLAISLRCPSCGYRSHGWRVAVTPILSLARRREQRRG